MSEEGELEPEDDDGAGEVGAVRAGGVGDADAVGREGHGPLVLDAAVHVAVDDLDAEYALNEGGGNEFPFGPTRFYSVQTAEKGLARFRMRVRGEPGTTVSLGIRHADGSRDEVDIVRAEVSIPPVAWSMVPGKNEVTVPLSLSAPMRTGLAS